MPESLSAEEAAKLNEYWFAANYLTVGQIYLRDNPLLERPLTKDDIKPRLLGHWGTTAGLNFIYTHLNRLIQKTRSEHDVHHRPGPWRAGIGRAYISRRHLHGDLSEHRAESRRHQAAVPAILVALRNSQPRGARKRRARFTKAASLGYSLLHAYGAAFDNPDLIVACIVGDGEAETGACAASWHSNKFLNPAKDGAVLPILHLNGYKIANPTVLARISEDELRDLFIGYGYEPHDSGRRRSRRDASGYGGNARRHAGRNSRDSGAGAQAGQASSARAGRC